MSNSDSTNKSLLSWPLVFTTQAILTTDRHAWLVDPQNQDLSFWRNLHQSNDAQWNELEHAIVAVCGRKNVRFNHVFGPALGRLLANAPDKATFLGTESTSEAKTLVGSESADALAAQCLDQTDEAAKTWLRNASMALAPRMLYLFKKRQRRTDTITIEDSNEDMPGVKRSSTTRKTPTTTPVKPPNSTKPETVNEPALKRQKVNGRLYYPTNFNEISQQLHNKATQPPLRILAHKNLFIQVDDAVRQNATDPRFIVVGISAVLVRGAQDLDHTDIRPDLLDWAIFKAIVKETCGSYDLSNTKLQLACCFPGQEDDGQAYIRNENQFRWGIGVFEWMLREKAFAGDIWLSLSML